jgi:ABC-type Fe3+-hydroxamate transport system substrate-binding protein
MSGFSRTSGLAPQAVEHAPRRPDARIVCLVPSVTELVCDLGLAPQLVGRTGFCIHPGEVVKSIPKVGGTKDVKLDRIRELAPTHVVVNVEREPARGRRGDRRVRIGRGHAPARPVDNPPLYRLLGGIFGREAEAEELCARFEATLRRSRRANGRTATSST